MPRRIVVTAIIELDGGVLIDRRGDDGSWAFLGGVEDDAALVIA